MADVVALAMLLTGIVPLENTSASFGSDTYITILGPLVLTVTLLRTGVVDYRSALLE